MTFEELKSITKGKEYPVLYENENGEPVFIYWVLPKDEIEECFKTETYQSNGWIRDNYYYEDGTVEELFRKEN